MLKRHFEKKWVQNGALLLMLGLLVYYFGFIFEFKYDFNWTILYKETQYGFMSDYLVNGLNLTITISLYSAILALGLGTVFGLARLSKFKPVYWFATCYVELFRNTPMLIQLFFWNFALPYAFPEEIRFKLFELNFEFWVAVGGLGIFTSAFMAEIIRSGIQSVPKGLLEASYSSGLSFGQTLRRIILPLAFREIIPPLGSEFLNNMKNSSLAQTIGVMEVFWAIKEVSSLTYHSFEALTAGTVIYTTLSLFIAGFMALINAKLKIVPKGQENTLRKVADLLFAPFGMAYRRASRTKRRIARKRAASKTLSPAERMMQLAWKGFVLSARGAFLLFLAVLLYKTTMALLGFNWEVIFKSLKTLLIWRFPDGAETEFFYGLGGLSVSILMAVFSISGSFLIGLFVGMGRTSTLKFIRIPCTAYIELIRANPLLIVITWVFFLIPVMFKFELKAFWAGTWALTIFFGAYIAEIVRAGIQNIPPGQVEAAKSTGLSYFQTMRKIVLPQALKQMLPALVGMFIADFKDTSLVYTIGVMDLTRAAYAINNRTMIYPFEIYTTVAFLYFVCCFCMSKYAAHLERKLSPEQVRLDM
ncbi:amino acid ABC transporter permease [Salidesulfovibrio onnuriiensis]|uniref:amino acid ABC transporter permease n=1 Tax=Salidesulfovibrio onnuriiensis TaxID=2583823 RepID=UPI0011CAF277|nr:amino acid ABC transporter permease [Salidesulfovibrio onnuriiensis]